MIHKGIALKTGTFKRAGEAARSPPLSSKMGIMEMMKIIISPETFPPRAEVSHCTNESVMDEPRFYNSCENPAIFTAGKYR